MSGIGYDIVSVGASAQGDFTVSWVAPGMIGREAEGGCDPRVPEGSSRPLRGVDVRRLGNPAGASALDLTPQRT